MKFKIKLYNIYKNELNREIFGFFIAGIVANLVSFITYIVLIKYFLNSILTSAILGQIFGVISNYVINSRFVFKKRLNPIKKFFYLTYYLSAIYLVGKLIEIITNFGFDYRLSWLIGVVSATFFNFIFLKLIAFKR